jgi:hypothetical protein
VRAFLLAAFQSIPSPLPTVSLSFWANVGSIAGFLATLLTWFWAYRSRRYYLLVGRVPEYIERLRESTERLAVSNNAANRDRSEILRALKRVRESVESIRRNMSWRKRSDFESLTNQIRQIENADSLDPNVIDEVWTEAQALANRADDIVQDRKFTQGS